MCQKIKKNKFIKLGQRGYTMLNKTPNYIFWDSNWSSKNSFKNFLFIDFFMKQFLVNVVFERVYYYMFSLLFFHTLEFKSNKYKNIFKYANTDKSSVFFFTKIWFFFFKNWCFFVFSIFNLILPENTRLIKLKRKKSLQFIKSTKLSIKKFVLSSFFSIIYILKKKIYLINKVFFKKLYTPILRTNLKLLKTTKFKLKKGLLFTLKQYSNKKFQQII